MADKYIIHGATYCGDGTASNEAASAGAAGAWNDINVFEGTAPAYGTAPAAGHVVAIRSKTSAGADITRTLAATATLGSASGVATGWVTWILDNGAVWSGIDGALTYNCPSTYVVNARSYNQYNAMTQDALRIVETNAAANNKNYWSGHHVKTSKMLFDFSFATTSAGAQFTTSGAEGCTHEDIHVKSFRRSAMLYRANSNNRTKFINPDIELLDPTETESVFLMYDNMTMEVLGGQVRGAGAVSGVRLFTYRSGVQLITNGFIFPRQMIYHTPESSAETTAFYQLNSIGTDGAMGAVFKESWGLADSRDDNNYPTLNATLPDTGSTNWAWKLCPMTTTEQHPLKMLMSQYFTESAASKEITVNLLIATTLTNVNKSSVWITVDYTDDSTGLKKSIITRNFAAGELDTSTANWTATTYGAASLLKREISVTTPTSIRSNTPITVVLWSTVKAASATDELGDVMFLCPEFGINAP